MMFFLLLMSFYMGFEGQTAEDYERRYGVKVLQDLEVYRVWAVEHPDKVLVEIKKEIPHIVLDIRYATRNNFTKKKVYSEARAFCIKPVLDSLKEIEKELNKKGLGLKIYDAYRPYRFTVKFYELTKGCKFVAPPTKGSKHNRGCAVDLTLIDLKTKRELEMPTAYDAFVLEAHPNAILKNGVARRNRDMLINIMDKHGFVVDPIEWWHYNFKGYGALGIPIFDIGFEVL